MIRASAPGKLMLFGEHAVVYGRPCIVISVDHRMHVSLEKIPGDKMVLTAPDLNIEGQNISLDKSHSKKVSFLLTAVRNFFEKYDLSSGLKIETKSEFSDKVGLGSSSAVIVAAVKCLSGLFSINMSNKNIFDLSYKTVLDVQGLGSGFDVAAATYGGTLFFKTGGEAIEPVNVKDLPLVVGYTGIKADTPTLVRMVSEKKSKEPERINSVFDEMEKIVESAKGSLEKRDWEETGDLMNRNHDLLRGLDVSSRELEALIKASLDAGAYGAKLSGAGGGDCMIAVTDETNLDNVRNAIKKAGGVVIGADIPARGVF